MKELYFHIGLPKTGTSALQKFCDMNRDVLRKKGIYYPLGDVKQRADNSLVYSGNASDIKGIELINKSAETLDDEELSCIIDIKHIFNVDDVVLISTERLWNGGGLIESIYSLSTLLEPEKITIKIIVYLRRQDEYAESIWNQHIKCDCVFG